MALFDLRTDVFFFLIARYNDLKPCGIKSSGDESLQGGYHLPESNNTKGGKGNGQLENG